ncbi:MAG: DUF2807 domain-containing protein [Bacteroidales bacterium]|nr:DUF2807 domain-containing protein [Bacteroidales bacterium]MBN2820424.1 DUF2807 domain-containing protein [Bacteroidales bacterium]
MKTKFLLLATIALSLIFTSCEDFGNYVSPSDEVSTENRTVTGFRGIDVSHAFNVYVSFSDAVESVEIEANSNLQQYIEVETKDDMLVIKLKDRINIRGNATLNAYISSDYLTDYMASGASNIHLEDVLYANSTSIELSGASNFYGHIEADKLISDISGASNIDLTGNLDYLRLNASGASTIKDFDLSVNKFEADLSGASNAKLMVNDELDIEASGASNVYYKGQGVIVFQDLSGASNIKKR